MSTNELTSKIKELRELQALIDEAQAEAEAIKEDVSPVIEEINAYIERSHLPATRIRYDMTSGQLTKLRTLALTDPTEALLYAFRFGRAKGYRMGRAEAKKHN